MSRDRDSVYRNCVSETWMCQVATSIQLTIWLEDECAKIPQEKKIEYRLNN